MSEVQIRAAKLADAAEISTLVRQSAQKFIVADFTPEGAKTLLDSMSAEALEERIRSGYRYHVAQLDGQLVGVVGVRGDFHLYALFVAEPFHRRGIGRRLWNHALAECLARGHRGPFTVNSSRMAVPVYGQFGFQVTGEEIDIGGVLSIPMQLILEPTGEPNG